MPIETNETNSAASGRVRSSHLCPSGLWWMCGFSTSTSTIAAFSSDTHRHQDIKRVRFVILAQERWRSGIGEVDLDRVAVDLAEDVEQVAGVEADLEPVGAIIGGQLLGREAVLRARDRQGHLVAVETDFNGAGLLAGNRRNAVYGGRKDSWLVLEQLVV